MSLTLYYHPLASYCHKVLIALYEAGTRFDGQIIDLGDEADRAALRAHWPLLKFPVLYDSSRKRSVPESSSIIEYLDRHYPGNTALVPSNADSDIEVRLWDRIFDNYVQTPMQQIVADRIQQAHADMTGARALLDASYRLIDSQLASRAWIAHEDFSLADCAAAPALFYASTLQPLPAALPNLRGYFERLMGRPSVRRTLEEARPYFHMYPFAEAIPQRFTEGANASHASR
jgi:glutathione S-transferase